MQIFAGAGHIIGRPVSKGDRERSKKRIEKWVRGESGSGGKEGWSGGGEKAALHAARILRDGMRKLKEWDAGDSFCYPWCLYLATLTIWAFQVCQKGQVQNKESEGALRDKEDGIGGGKERDEEGKTDESGNEDDNEWDSKVEMSALISAMTRAREEDLGMVVRRYKEKDLPRVVARVLERVRWAVVREGMVVLRGLGNRRN